MTLRTLLILAGVLALAGATAEVDPNYPLSYGLKPETRYVSPKDVVVKNRAQGPVPFGGPQPQGWRLRPFFQPQQVVAPYPESRVWLSRPQVAYYYTYPHGYYGFPYQYYPVNFVYPVK
ncbi:uncharacterized protein LOC135393499 [Ornithodoros turicata]|uniref:uncharacterized protein LOC135393499 n=1 Tax=Ornithodoros turicata TaxID=34597 RepID=UPI0031393784